MAARVTLVEQLLDLAWSHWAALGVAGSVRAAEVPIDLEALLLLTAELAAEDPRLRDEALDWCSRFHGFASKPRLKQLLRRLPPGAQSAFGSFAGALEHHAGTPWPSSSGQVVVGEASEESLRWLKSVKFFASARMLFESTNPHSDDPRAVATFYVGSWFLVTYLLNGEDEAFGRFQKQLHQLVPWRRAWDEAFDGMTPATLDEKLQAYARQGGNLSIFTFEMSRPSVEPRLRALSSAEAHGVKALLASAAAPEVAEPEMQAALALDPDDLAALSVQFRATPADPPEPRARIAERAVAAHPQAGEAWFLRATAAPDQESRERALKRAAALEPSHPGVALLVAEDALQQGKPALALERSRFVLQRSALSPNVLGLYAAALEATGRCSESATLAANASALFDSSCRVGGHAMGELIGCAAYVQSRVGSSIAPCTGPKRAARAQAH